MAITFNHNDQVYVKDGKMGIGASDPLRDLHVVGDFAVNAGTDEYYGVLIQGGESATPKITIGDWHNSSATIKWDSSANHLVIDSQHATSTSSIVFTGNDSATEYMRITSSGNVGIGTTSPTDKLHVAGNLNVGDNKVYNGSSNNSAGFELGGSRFNIHGYHGITFNSSNAGIGSQTERMRITSAGNVGIGTTSPGDKLQVNSGNIVVRSGGDTSYIAHSGSTDVHLAIAGRVSNYPNPSSNAGSIILTKGTTGEAYPFDAYGHMVISSRHNASTDILFRTNGTLRGVIKGDGKFGVGTTSPQSPLTVKSNSTSSASSGFTLLANGSTDIIAAIGEKSTNGGRFHLYDGGSQKVAFFSDGTDNFIAQGNLGIGTTSPNHKLDIYSNENVPLRIHRPSNANLDSSGAWGIGFSTRGDANTSTTDTRAGIFSYYNGNLFLATNNASIVSDPDAYARLTILNGGNVGIGTTSPSKKLHISDDNDAPLRVESTDPTTGIEFKDNSDSSQLYYVGGSDHFYIPSGTSLGVGASSPTLGSMLRVYSNQTTADESVYGSFFDFNTTGSDTITANRTQAAIYVDADSSTTGGSTASGTEHRFYGIYSDTRASGDSDFIAGITTRAEANATSGQVTNTRGGDFLAVSDGNDSAATHNNVIGTISSAYAEDAATLNSLVGASSYAYVNSNRTTDISTLTGHSSEVEINADNTYGTAYLYRGTLDINSTHTITDTYAFRYDISGTSVATNNWGIYIDDVDKNYVSGKLGIGTGSPGENLTISGKVLSYGGTGTVGAGTSYFLGNSNNSRDIALTRVDSGALGIGRYNSGWLETMRFTIDGKVGIGTTSPNEKLHVVGDSVITGGLAVGEHTSINPNSFVIDAYRSSTATSGDSIGLHTLRYQWSGTNTGRVIGTYSAAQTSNTSTLTTAIGIYGTARHTSSGTLTNAYSLYLDSPSGSPTNAYNIYASGSANNYIGGDVGIGTTSPGQKLQVEGAISAGTANSTEGSLILVGKYSNGNIITIGGGYSGGGVVIGYGVKPSTTAAGAFLSSSALSNLERSAYVQYGSIHQWWTGAYQTVAVDSAATLTQSMTLDGSGNLGIGTTSPGAKLHANASSGVAFKVSPNSTSKEWYIDTTNPDHLKKEENLVLSADPGNTHTNTVIGFRIDNSTKMQIKSDGKVGIGTTSPAYLLDVSGTIRATGDVIAYSDARVKENVETIPNALDKVKGMRGVGYNKIGEEKRSVGVIAQELLEVLPEAVHQDDQGMYSVAYGNIVGVLIESIKELENRVEALEQKIKQNGITE